MLTTKVDIYKSVKSIFSRYQTISIKSRGTDLDSYFFNLVAALIGISVGKKTCQITQTKILSCFEFPFLNNHDYYVCTKEQ